MVGKVIALVHPLRAYTGRFRAIPERLTGCEGVGYLFVCSLSLAALPDVYLSYYLRLFLDG